MSHRWIGIVAALLLVTGTSGFPALAQEASAQDVLRQYVLGLQASPGDDALREKLIRHALAMTPPPAVPEDAERFMVRGTAAVKEAKGPADFQDAAAEFSKAVAAAPWLANAYYNLGIAQEKAGEYARAIKSFKSYLLAAPDAADAKDVKARTYELEYRQEKAMKDAPKVFLEELKAKYEGARYRVSSLSYLSESALFAQGEGFPGGGTEEEALGANWYPRDFDLDVVFSDDGMIRFGRTWNGERMDWLRGAVQGTSVEEITWEVNTGGSSGNWVPSWVRIIDGLDKLQFSWDRPADDAGYSVRKRYRYETLKRK